MDGKEHILFNVGYSDVFIRNAQTMKLDLWAVSTIVLSHGHNDHTGGLSYLMKQYRFSLISSKEKGLVFLKMLGNRLIT